MKKLLAIILALATVLSVAVFPVAADSVSTADKMLNNFVTAMADGSLDVFATPRNNYSFDSNMSQLRTDTDGTMYFSTISYAKYYQNDDFSHLSDHLSRTLAMAMVYNTTTDAELKAQLGDIIPALLGYWVKNDYQCSNWWYNEINTPNLISEIALLVKDEISPELMEGVLAIAADGCITINTARQNDTGANGTWFAYSTLKYGILANDTAAIQKAAAKLEETLSFRSGEGIKEDGSFMQHGSRLYNGAYGVALIENTAAILRIFDGTSYAFTADKLNALSTMILEGLKYMSLGNSVDPQTVGRDISRVGGTDLGGLSNSLKKLAALESMPNKAELLAYASTIDNNTRQNLGLKYFDNAKFIVINNSDFYFSYRGAAKNLYYAENLNNENILSYNSSYGTTTTIAGDTVNFESLQPIMDYAMIPGTTAIYEDDAALAAHTDYNKRTLSGVFGGDSYGDTAVSFAQTTHEGISYTAACFATDSSAILLGAGLSNTSGAAMNTTLQQELAQGSFVKNGSTVTHNGVKYTVYEGGTLNASIETKSGSWSRNKVSASSDTVTGEVFTLSMENNGSYAYSVMSDSTNDSYEVVANNEKVQAVIMPDGSLCAAFYTVASVTYNGKTIIGTAGQSVCIPADELIPEEDPCVSTVTVSPKNGTYYLSLGGTEVGEVTLASSGSGWTIKNSAGKFLGVDSSGNLTVGGTASVWSYNNGFYVQISTKTKVLFWTSTKNTNYYLTVSGGTLTTTTSSVAAVLKQEITNDSHSYAYVDNGNGSHKVYCTVCGKVSAEAESCSYNADTHCCTKCGHVDPNFFSLNVSVNVTKTQTKRLFSTKTTYTAAITVDCVGDTVKTVQYSTNNSKWSTGTSYSSSSSIGTLYVKVTTANGTVSTWLYNGSTTTKLS